MRQQNIEEANIFGYSMGGYAGMYISKHNPEKINKLITLATKFYWDETIALKEVKMLDAAAIELKVPAFAQQLKKRHAPADWKLLLQKTAEMMLDLGKSNTLKQEDYSDIKRSSLLMLGDRDKMVTLDETAAVYKSLSNAEMCVLPNTPHPLEQVDVESLAFMIKRFLL
jgi:pimeloyl-ACP methyl ester carboxylesterase